MFEVVSMTVPALLNPKMTASWEKGLDGITRGTVIMEDYRSKLEDFIRKETVSMIEHDLTGNLAARIHPFVGKGGRGLAAKKKIEAVCPVCGGRWRRHRSAMDAVIIKRTEAAVNFPSEPLRAEI